MNDYYCAFLEPSAYDLSHHGIKGMKWGVRRWQNADGSYNAAGKARYGFNDGKSYSGVKTTGGKKASSSKSDQITGKKKKGMSTGKKVAIGVGVAAAAAATAYGIHAAKKAGLFNKNDTRSAREKFNAVKNVPVNDIKNLKEYANTYLLGQSTKDRVIKSGTQFSRIQGEKDYQNFEAYYATYKKGDVKTYEGLFGNQIRMHKVMAKFDGDQPQPKTFKELFKDTQPYKVSLDANSDLNVASDKSASKVLSSLMRNDADGSFKSDVKKSIDDMASYTGKGTKSHMFKAAQRALDKDPSQLTNKEKSAIYKAFNITLVDHDNDYNSRSQSKFYDAMRKAGYDAIDDINDRNYSSIRAARPTIVFNTAKTTFANSRQMSNKEVSSKARKAAAKEFFITGDAARLAAVGTTIVGAKKLISSAVESKKATDSVKRSAGNTTIAEAKKKIA